MALTVHIGFDFWGAGNLGDDLMLAGFQLWVDRHLPDCRLSALCAHDIEAMRRRFPRIEWFGADSASREAALSQADVWLGLGGGVFQIEVGPWILDQMLANISAAKRRGIPAFLVGVGVNNLAALQTSQSQEVHRLADGIWLRDESCLEMAFSAGFSAEKTQLGADTAHLYCAANTGLPHQPGAAFVLHASPDDLSYEALTEARRQLAMPAHWVCQEYRPIPDSEALLHQSAPAEFQNTFPCLRPDYPHADIAALHAAVAPWDYVLSSRFHTSLAAAWQGARLAIFERNDKLRSIRNDLGCERCARLDDATEIARSLRSAHPVSPARLAACLQRADTMMHAFAAAL